MKSYDPGTAPTLAEAVSTFSSELTAFLELKILLIRKLLAADLRASRREFRSRYADCWS